MADLKSLVEREMDRAGEPTFAFEDLDGLRARRHRTKRITAAAVGLGLVLILGLLGASIYRSTPRVPADPPEEPTVDLGIFAPVAGKIIYYEDSSLWAVDPNAPSPVSTLVPLDVGGTTDADRFASFTLPLGWSRDGTELLFLREDPTDDTFPHDRHLYILHADGTETQVTPEPVGGAAISPDGTRVVFASDGGGGLYAVDPEGGQPVRITDVGESPTFSPDGTQIAYLSESGQAGIEHVWVANANGTDAHEILTDEALDMGMGKLTWSPAGDLIAMENQQEGHVAIYTFAPDGSDFTKVITGGFNHSWSPDGTQIAYGLPGRDGVSIADADGSNVQVFSFGGVGPWHPGTGAAPDTGDVPDLRSNGKDVLDRIAEGEVVNLWPDTSRNQPGLYSWDGPRPGAAAMGRIVGFMHNGYGSGDVAIFLEVVPEEAVPDDGKAITVAGHDGTYRRIDEEREQWIVTIEGTTISIRLEARRGTSQADLADAYAILGSMRTQPQNNDLGFRLVFALTTNEWDSG